MIETRGSSSPLQDLFCFEHPSRDVERKGGLIIGGPLKRFQGDPVRQNFEQENKIAIKEILVNVWFS